MPRPYGVSIKHMRLRRMIASLGTGPRSSGDGRGVPLANLGGCLFPLGAQFDCRHPPIDALAPTSSRSVPPIGVGSLVIAVQDGFLYPLPVSASRQLSARSRITGQRSLGMYEWSCQITCTRS